MLTIPQARSIMFISDKIVENRMVKYVLCNARAGASTNLDTVSIACKCKCLTSKENKSMEIFC